METVARRSMMKGLPFFVPAALLAAGWIGVNVAFPKLGPTGIPMELTRFAIDVAILAGLSLGLGRAGVGRGARQIAWVAIAIPFVGWNVVVHHLAVGGFFVVAPGPLAAPPTLPMAIFLPLVVLLPFLLWSKRVGAVLDAMPRSWLIGVQLYRVLGSTFLVYWLHRAVPGAFAWPAGVGDVLVGLFALPVAMRAGSLTPEGRRAGISWKRAGFDGSYGGDHDGDADIAGAIPGAGRPWGGFATRVLSSGDDPDICRSYFDYPACIIASSASACGKDRGWC